MSLHDTAINVQNLSKIFKIYSKPSDMFLEVFTGKPRYREFRALQDITFEVKRGEVVGVIGRNGSGKSTLLKILAGTLDASSGSVQVEGKISAILELGSGFHPEYSGRENIYMGGMCLGMSREEVERKIDWIIDFSELRDFIDQPFKTYSTGMQARLTFSTAVSIDPDILIIDEALGAGDAKFQRKCYDKITEICKSGHTIIMVSHDLNSVSTFCDKAFLLEGGRIVERGQPLHVTKAYYRMLFSRNFESPPDAPAVIEDESPAVKSHDHNTWTREELISKTREEIRVYALRKLGWQQAFKDNNSSGMRLGNGKAEILDYGIMDENDECAEVLTSGFRYTFFMRGVFYEDVEVASAGFLIRNVKGVDLFGSATWTQGVDFRRNRKGDIVEIKLPLTMWLTNDAYFLTVALGDPLAEEDVQFDLHYDGLRFEVRRIPGIFTTSVVNLDAKPISIKRITQKDCGVI